MKKIKLGDYIEILTDYHSGGSYKTLKEKTKILYEPDYAVMIRTLNFERNDFANDLIYCDKQSYDFLNYSHVRKDDVLMNKIANPGSVYIMPHTNYKCTCGMNLFLLRFKNINQRYMYYVMKNSEAYIKSKAHGTTTKTITKDEVRNLEFKIHKKIDEQNKIERFLTNIDTKIENNNKINNNLEDLALTIFLHDFGNKNPNGRIEQILFENSKSKVKVGDTKDVKGDYPFFTSGESVLEWDEYFVDGRTLFLNTGGNADVKFYVGKAAYSTDTWAITTNNDMSDYLYLYLKSIKSDLDRKFFNGSGLKHLQKPLFKQENIYIPSNEELINFNNKVKSFFNIITANKLENKKLNSLKEFLLPMLMNGQINVDDIEI